jgi:hypothetical protein
MLNTCLIIRLAVKRRWLSKTDKRCGIALSEEPVGLLINAATKQPFTYNDPCVERDPPSTIPLRSARHVRKAPRTDIFSYPRQTPAGAMLLVSTAIAAASPVCWRDPRKFCRPAHMIFNSRTRRSQLPVGLAGFTELFTRKW